MSATTWTELVTTALLGVTRRPLSPTESSWSPRRPRSDEAVRLLDLAAAHSAATRVGAAPLAETVEPQIAPEQRHPVAPPRATDLLSDLMRAPEPALIGGWLSACVAARRTVAPAQWTWLARAAARSTLYDRAMLGRALGEAGRWFLRQNPDWRRLAADATAGALTPPVPPGHTRTPGRPRTPTAVELAADPEILFARPDPWPVELVAAAWAMLGSGGLGVRAHNYAVGVGMRMPPQFYPRLADAATYYLEAPEASPALRRSVRHNFVVLERTAFARAEIAAAFDETATGFERVEIPHV